jgi:hypothetical protein
MNPMRLLTTFVLSFLCFVALPASAHAGPSASGSISTKGARGSSSGGGYDWPDLVYGGNAISFLAPFQIGAVGYLPKGRFAFQYDRQILKGHWFHVGVGIGFDRAYWKNFRMDACGLTAAGRTCGRGGVVGFDIYAGYMHKFYLKAKPWLVPYVKGSLGYSLFALPRVGEDETLRLQNRTRSQYIALKPGGGFRLFLTPELGLGSEINIPFGVLIHRNVTDDGVGNVVRDKQGRFLLGFEIMALVLEYRF